MSAPNKHQQRTEQTRRKLLEAACASSCAMALKLPASKTSLPLRDTPEGRSTPISKPKRFIPRSARTAIGQTSHRTARDSRAVNFPEGAVKALRARYLKRAEDLRWVILALEFKLFALRHGKLRAKLAAAHRRIRRSMNFDAITKFLPPRLYDAKTAEGCKVMLEVVLSGLVLEHAYDPRRISRKQMADQLGQIFDIVLNQR